ncbi:alcohol dehydrogenase catalytic domain-containing protein [Devosia algicola]|uniref:Alcohol dehydrogenase catalytic domain-containing protein n=1 Tax=Devosia algicola TaxID=3026418 RepID=A0ABY7YJ61_9HYPH|nr:alcohol dehydrogenase catalytic domain-containing protein [Devosia algicola]WDR01325.1 alcohol dehydrogenase catalytic domain-containing protein [Devosia algicola]
MLALKKTQSGAGYLDLVEGSFPVLEGDEVLVKVWSAGICGSDVLIEKDRHFYKAPVTLGHEFSGVIEAVGPDVRTVKVGDRIAADIETRSGWLGVTRNGAFASHMSVPEAQIFVYPETVSLDDICFTEPMVATVHAMEERHTVMSGDFVVVVGPGPMGLLGVQMARFKGAGTIVVIGRKGIDERRLAIAKQVGANHVLYSEDNPEAAIFKLSEGRGADFVLECSATATGFQHGIDCARRSPEGRGGAGKISVISLWGEPITVQPDAISLYQLDLRGSWSWNGPETWRRAVELVQSGSFDFSSVLTGRYALADWRTAFDSFQSCQDCKVFLYPNGADWQS